MDSIFAWKDLLPHGRAAGEALCFTRSFTLAFPARAVPQCIQVSAMARYEGEAAPHISFELSLKDYEKPFYLSHRYRLGNALAFTQQSWRVPPMLHAALTLCVHVDIPRGTVLYLQNFDARYAAAPRDHAIGPRHNAHLGFLGLAPDNTMPAFELAAICGFPACIAVPKVTKDGVLVCLHDETINRTGRNADGSEPSAEPLRVKDLTYAELLQYDFGVRKRPTYKGTKIPRLEDFFKLCARTGMRPMFSTHPALPLEKWHEVKKMLTRLGLLRHFHVKSFSPDILKTAHSVLSEEIDGYTLDVQKMEEDTIEQLLATGIDPKKCRVGIEIRSENLRFEDVHRVLEAGMFAAAWNLPRCDFDDFYEKLISWGVTEFTEDYHCSMGLNY